MTFTYDPEQGEKKRTHSIDERTPLVEKEYVMSAERKKWIFIALATAGLLVVGVAVGMLEEHWTFLTSVYVIVQIITTIGYGDLVVTKDVTKLICAFYVLCVLVIIAYVINLMFQQLSSQGSDFIRGKLRVIEAGFMARSHSLADLEEKELDKLLRKMKRIYGPYNKIIAATAMAVFAIGFGTVFYATYEACSCSYGKTAVKGCVNPTYDMCVATGGYVNSWITSFYMSVITLTTVGFGDHSPKSRLGRSIGIFWMLFGVCAMANWVLELSTFFFDRHKDMEDMVREEITDKVFKAIDKDQSGTLSRAEYLEYVLVSHGIVSKDDIETIDRHYDFMDLEKTEEVTFDMIKTATERAQKKKKKIAFGF